MNSVLGVALVCLLVYGTYADEPQIACTCIAGPRCPGDYKIMEIPNTCCQWKCIGPPLPTMCPKEPPGQVSTCVIDDCKPEDGSGCPWGQVCCKTEGCGGQQCLSYKWGPTRPCHWYKYTLKVGDTAVYGQQTCTCKAFGELQCRETQP